MSDPLKPIENARSEMNLTEIDARSMTTGCHPRRVFAHLERLTSAVLLAVVIAVGWMTAVAYLPELGHVVSAQIEVILMLALLTTALLLVSLVALLHT